MHRGSEAAPVEAEEEERLPLLRSFVCERLDQSDQVGPSKHENKVGLWVCAACVASSFRATDVSGVCAACVAYLRDLSDGITVLAHPRRARSDSENEAHPSGRFLGEEHPHPLGCARRRLSEEGAKRGQTQVDSVVPYHLLGLLSGPLKSCDGLAESTKRPNLLAMASNLGL